MRQDPPISDQTKRITVVVPAYRVSEQLPQVVATIGEEVSKIIVVDDFCPEDSGKKLQQITSDPRVEVIFHHKNLGVGAAVKTGYRRALEIGSDVVIKLDGDGQMDPKEIKSLVKPIFSLGADYVKANRFFEPEAIRQMPKSRIIGNLFLSFMTKLSTGYWRIFDPNNGFTAISAEKLKHIPLNKVADRYFFESDMLFRLYLVSAAVVDIPIPAKYGKERSNLKIKRVIIEFPFKHSKNFLKRIVYSYYIREFNLASLQLPIGIFLGILGIVRGATAWHSSNITQIPTAPGTVVLFAVLILTSIQLILAFLNFDINNEPKLKYYS